MADEQQNLTQVALIPSPGMGHIIPLVELAKRIVRHESLAVTLIIPTLCPPPESQTSILRNLPSSISHVFLPASNMNGLSIQNTRAETLISLTVIGSLPSIREELKRIVSSGHKLAAVVTDLFSTDCFDLANELNAAPYLFYPSTAMALSLFLYLPKLDETVDCEFRELNHPIEIPGCVPIPGGELLDPIQDRRNDAYKWMLHHTKKYKLAAGIMVNSFLELEKGPIKALQDPKHGYPPVYAVGPLAKQESVVRGKGSECLEWLNDQPPNSVLYVSFGSGGTLTREQTTELAMGLEMSEQRFIWVMKRPSEKTDAAFFNVDKAEDLFSFLPDGFWERTKGRGVIMGSWGPQSEVLSHGSTGGFLTHCGWNSTMESVVNGVPLIAWPLYAEQKMNALLLSGVGIALRPRGSTEKGLVWREEISSAVRSLMGGEGGEAVRSRMRHLSRAAAEALRENGSANESLREIVALWKNSF